MAPTRNLAWQLESFLDAVRVELDRAQDTLALKALNGRRLSYSVKDVQLDLQIFPMYDGSTVRFTTAEPGQEGSSKLSLQLGSITDRMIRETTKDPVTQDDIPIESMDGIDEDTKRSLKEIGVDSARDLVRLEDRKIDLGKVTKKPMDYRNLATIIQRSRRVQMAPVVRSVSLHSGEEGTVLRLAGNNLAPLAQAHGFPVAALDDLKVEVVSAKPDEIRIALPKQLRTPSGELKIALDPFALLRLTVKAKEVAP
jgi:hypothetical protein